METSETGTLCVEKRQMSVLATEDSCPVSAEDICPVAAEGATNPLKSQRFFKLFSVVRHGGELDPHTQGKTYKTRTLIFKGNFIVRHLTYHQLKMKKKGLT